MPRHDETLWQCSECHATTHFQCRFDNDMPERWFRLEDNGCWYVLCSAKCLLECAKVLVEEQAADAT